MYLLLTTHLFGCCRTCQLHQGRNARANRVFMNFEDSLMDWRGANKVLVRNFEMCAKESARLRLVRFGGGFAEIVAHAPENVQSRNIQHYGVKWQVKKAEEILGRREP